MELTDSLKILLIATAKSLQGSARRFFMARTVKARGPGGQQRAARALRWGRMTIRTGMPALDSGVICVDAFALRGRKRAAAHRPHLLTDRPALVDSPSQAAPPCRSHRLYTRLTAAEVRRQWMAQKGSPDAALPTAATMGTKVKERGDSPPKVAQSPPPKNARQPTRASTRERGSSGRPMPRRRCDASRWMPRRPSQSVRVPAVASTASRPSPPTTTFPQTRPCPPWASPSRRWMHCFCLGSPPK
jgi:hypothetical protein